MLGRCAYEQPYLLSDVDNELFKLSKKTISREDVLKKYKKYFSCFSLFILVFQMLLAYVNVETVLLKLDKVMYQHHITRLQQ